MGDKANSTSSGSFTQDGKKTSSLSQNLVKSLSVLEPPFRQINGINDFAVEDMKEENRGAWGSRAEFLLSCMGFAVGLGALWRFPYLVYSNGGGAFLIPYLLMLIFVGVPAFMAEIILGQYARGGPNTAWSLVSPLFKGVGIGTIIMCFITSVYYNYLLAWVYYYMFASFQPRLPWSRCNNDFNTIHCYSKIEASGCENEMKGNTYFNQTCYNTTYIANDVILHSCTNSTAPNITAYASTPSPFACTLRQYLDEQIDQRAGAAEEYFNRGMLSLTNSINDTGNLKLDLTLALLFAWLICYICIFKGIHSAGKVVYFTAVFPYVLIVIFVIRGALLPGSLTGVKFYLIPDFDVLKKPKVWVDAAGQVFFSLSVGMGGLTNYASFNKFNHNFYWDVIIVCASVGLTSLISGFAIFSILGHMAFVLGKEVKDVAKAGGSLAFVAYPEVVMYFPVSQLWSFLFFMMLFTLGIDSLFAMVENISGFLADVKPSWRTKKPIVTLVLCIVLFLVGLPQCTQAGYYWEELMSYYSGGWALVLLAFVEMIVLSYVYGSKNLLHDFEVMTGTRLRFHWYILWTFVAPVFIAGILMFNMYNFIPLKVGDYQLEPWAQALGWLMALASVVCIPVMAVQTITVAMSRNEHRGKSVWQFIYSLTQPRSDWRFVEELYKKKLDDMKNKNESSEESNSQPEAKPTQPKTQLSQPENITSQPENITSQPEMKLESQGVDSQIEEPTVSNSEKNMSQVEGGSATASTEHTSVAIPEDTKSGENS